MTEEAPKSEKNLALVTQELIKKIEELDSDKGDQMVRLAELGKRNRLFIRALGVVSAVLLLFAVLIGYNSNEVSQVTARLDKAQSTGRKQALCPLYQLFLDSRNARARAASPNGPKAYDDAFKVIEQGYKALGCVEFKLSPSPLSQKLERGL